MTVIPEYYGSELWDILQGGMWISLCQYLLTEPKAREAFEKETGHNFNHLKPNSPLDAMIDQCTGRNAAVMAAWCDWVTVNHWGIESAH